MPTRSDADTTLHDSNARDINARLLREWPLPMPSHDADKEGRGHLLIIGGSREMPGAMILAGTAALRAGVGKLSIVSAEQVAPLIAAAIPEARVLGLKDTAEGGLLLDGPDKVVELAGKVDAILIGPGFQDDSASIALVGALLPHCRDIPVILDAAAMGICRFTADGAGEAFRFDNKVLLTPHAGEMAHLSGIDKQTILDRPASAATTWATRWNATVALKGALTVIAAPSARHWWRHQGGNCGLAISGSGDTLAGIIAGLAGRGAPLDQAAAWGVSLHAMAGEQLALRHGPLGYLAREISFEVPALLRALASD